MCKQLLLTLLTLSVVSFSAQAKNLYVDGSTGNDSTTYAANDATHPWATIGRAVWGSTSVNNGDASEAAQAGDTVIVKPGTYTATQGTGKRYDPIWCPENSGTSGNPITIRAEGPVILRSNTGTIGEPVIGAYGRDHIVWDGFFC